MAPLIFPLCVRKRPSFARGTGQSPCFSGVGGRTQALSREVFRNSFLASRGREGVPWLDAGGGGNIQGHESDLAGRALGRAGGSPRGRRGGLTCGGCAGAF